MFSVEDNDEVIRVTCKIPARKRARDPYVKISTSEVLDFLANEGYNVSNYTLNEVGMCINANGEVNLSDVWSWTKPEQKVVPKTTKKEVFNAKSTTRTTRATRKRKQSIAQKDKLLST